MVAIIAPNLSDDRFPLIGTYVPPRPEIFGFVAPVRLSIGAWFELLEDEEAAEETPDPEPPKRKGRFVTKKQEERKERAQARARRLNAAASAQLESARAELEHIPLGQPILVGHHSEGAHRNAIKRHDRKMHAAIETHEEAKRAEWAAGNAGRAITSDDPEALEALEAKLADLEAGRERAKAINKAWRKNGEDGLRAIGVPEAHIEQYVKLMVSCQWLKAPCDTRNTSANIRRVKRRIEEVKELQAQAEGPEVEPIVGDGFRIEEAPEDARIRFYFDERPDKATCKLMRGKGFRFSRTHGCWQRHLNTRGRWVCVQVAKELFGYEEGGSQ